jgi:hypothetical protein
MVKAIVEIDKRANALLNLLKVRYGLNDKSQAINEMAKQYEELILESNIRPEYIAKIKRIRNEPIIRVGTYRDFKKRYKVK